jgi:hypothetical protein
MSFFTSLANQSEDIRRAILVVVMTGVGIGVGVFGITTIRARFVAEEAKQARDGREPFAVIAAIATEGYDEASNAFGYASEGWREAATVFQAWNMSR